MTRFQLLPVCAAAAAVATAAAEKRPADAPGALPRPAASRDALLAADAAHTTDVFGNNFSFLLGTQEVADFYTGPPERVLSWTPLFAGSSESGDLGFTAGTAVDATSRRDGSVDRVRNKYLTLWARQADGSWRFIADGGAPSPSSPP